ncbi:BUD13 homolog [Polyergus mexicanus]|uniref:BUD13 homolog n=1 Tax=Polyergus mexicanus TaxID=615972 RepID=UPI0038B65218
MENKVINQKEYLKKYMSMGDTNDKKKKKKKKSKTGTKTVKIIDDDIDLKNMRPIEEGEFDILLNGEDAPQIAGIIDERGPVNFTDKRRWKIITENEEGDLTIINRTTNKNKILQMDETDANQNKNDDSDLNPSRSRHSNHADISPHRKSENKFKDNDSDLSPPRSRHSKNKHANLNSYRKSKGKAKDNDSDLSPPRQSRNNDNDSDLSPPRQFKNYDSDLDLPRKSMKHSTHSISERSYRSSRNRGSDSDFSPSRKRKQDLNTDLYESRKNKKTRDSNSDTSRRKEHRSRKEDSPYSSSRRIDRGQDYYDKNSSRFSRQDISKSSRVKWKEYEDQNRKSRSHSDTREKRKKSRWDEATYDSESGQAENLSKDRADRMTKTLDGKVAGFQAAKALREEIESHKQRDAELFNKLSNEVSGKGQATIVRDKQTGRKRNFEEETAKNLEQQRKQQEMDEKYAKWGKGLKQMEDREEKLKDDLYEMNKPLARYADDADLDKQLREQEREGDPMLEYIKQKQIKEGKRKPEPPQYQGSYAPNRFRIKPGYRWDGVDRSNGYEKKWFETQNAKVARQEEAYRWSTSDM